MVTKEQVQAAFHLILGREMHDEAIINRFIANYKDVAALLRGFLNSEEFQIYLAREAAGSTKFVHPTVAQSVDTHATEAELKRMVKHIEESWAMLGASEPHWSVLTAARYKADQIDANADEFFNSGKSSISEIKTTFARNNLDLARLRSCFELGCGVGRVSIWLAEVFDHVTAADISPAHLAIARETAKKYGRDNIDFLHVDHLKRLETITPFDFFFSVLVFQHNPPPVIRQLLTAILSRMRPAGVALFQIPSAIRNYAFSSATYPANPAGAMEMHAFPEREFFKLVAEQGCDVIEFRTDLHTNVNMLSHTVVLQKA
ncbi:methyltransferase family protein [Humitalea rosea]|uniref:Methyltransferase family protein n=1 Tax=Humitalea rosea TaxID=990373 RepID=A0A2W7IEG2_9PROT|nr:class I SAM-dependent methyltransferase [Humitalea rosea]PZW45135.1 methyltransferase family protein [Humitalea rosea]